MDHAAALSQIVKTFAAFWQPYAAECPIAYPDAEFTPPDHKHYGIMTIQTVDYFQSSIGAPGANRQERDGLITIQVFCDQNTRGKKASEKATLIVNRYINKYYDGVKYEDPISVPVGSADGVYQENVKIYFNFEQFA